MDNQCDFVVEGLGIEGSLMLNDRDKMLWDLSMQGLLTEEILFASKAEESISKIYVYLY